MFLLVPAYPGCPGSKAVKRLMLYFNLNLTSVGRTSVDIGASAKLELVDKFCYLGDMLTVDGERKENVVAL